MHSALALWLALAVAQSTRTVSPQLPPPVQDQATCTVSTLPGLFAQLLRVSRETGLDPTRPMLSGSSPAQAGRIADFWQIAFAVLGVDEVVGAGSGDHAAGSVGTPSLDALPCNPSVRSRDHMAWSMGLVGYSAREIADVLNGHLTRGDLDAALSQTMAGQPRTVVAAFLDSRWKDRPKTIAAMAPPDVAGSSALPTDQLDADIVALAREHRVEAALVRAIIAVESGGNARAVSSAGAIGLMQLMPQTAAALGVNPWQPAENLRGGIVYLAGLLRAYGEDVRLALIAYNAGPQHADLVRAGRAVAYRETRKYVEAIAARYPIP